MGTWLKKDVHRLFCPLGSRKGKLFSACVLWLFIVHKGLLMGVLCLWRPPILPSPLSLSLPWLCQNNRVHPLKKTQALWKPAAADPIKLSWPNTLFCCTSLSTSFSLSSGHHPFSVSRHPFNASFTYSREAFTEHLQLVTSVREPLKRRGKEIVCWASLYSYTTGEEGQCPVCLSLFRFPSSTKPNRWQHSNWFLS